MYGFDWQKISYIDELNENLNKYIEGIYHQVHSSINMKPIEKFIKYTDTMKFINSKEELDNIFLYRVKRRVIKDATVSIEKIKFEVPMQYILGIMQIYDITLNHLIKHIFLAKTVNSYKQYIQ
ncbi:hypothetical protein [Thermoanaerobacterium sp. RBIITD]|uniref:hypothetical protein n=1 Tax=Thermoanaerobacterium sp. RBIITD TaxID=1550240 RepID=UPI0018D53C33|nr:hypothetical protein [Thermoanaerobacterium sp. RBIITD]